MYLICLITDVFLSRFIESRLNRVEDFLYICFTSLSEESERLKILDFMTFLKAGLSGGEGNLFLGSFRVLGTLTLPLGFLFAFMNAPTSFFPVGVG